MRKNSLYSIDFTKQNPPDKDSFDGGGVKLTAEKSGTSATLLKIRFYVPRFQQ